MTSSPKTMRTSVTCEPSTATRPRGSSPIARTTKPTTLRTCPTGASGIRSNRSERARLKQLDNLGDGLAMMAEHVGERVDGRDKVRALLGETGLLPETVIEH